jgi:hypothetical protein
MHLEAGKDQQGKGMVLLGCPLGPTMQSVLSEGQIIKCPADGRTKFPTIPLRKACGLGNRDSCHCGDFLEEIKELEMPGPHIPPTLFTVLHDKTECSLSTDWH